MARCGIFKAPRFQGYVDKVRINRDLHNGTQEHDMPLPYIVCCVKSERM